MVTSLTSDEVFDDNIDSILHRTLRDVTMDSSLHRNQRLMGRDFYLLPTVDEIEYFISSDSKNFFSDDAISEFSSSEQIETLIELDTGRTTACCDESVKLRSSYLSAKDFIDIVVYPTGMDYLLSPRVFSSNCKRHPGSYYSVPALNGMALTRNGNPLTLADVTAGMGYIIRPDEMGDITVIDIINADGIESTYSASTKGGYNVSNHNYFDEIDAFGFRNNESPFKQSHAMFAEFAPYGEALTWYKLAGWRAGSVRNLKSRIDTVKKLIEISNAPDVLRYLRAGVPNVREVVKFIKADIDVESTEKAFRVGMRNPKFIKMVEGEDIDFELIRSMMEAA